MGHVNNKIGVLKVSLTSSMKIEVFQKKPPVCPRRPQSVLILMSINAVISRVYGDVGHKGHKGHLGLKLLYKMDIMKKVDYKKLHFI